MALTASQVELLYVAFYNRPADPAGLAYWESSSATYGQAANYFGASPEYTAMFTGLTNTQVVAQVYENMFNRLPDPAGLIYWSNLLTAGTLTLGSIALAIAGGAQGTDATILANKVTAATDFTNNIVTTPEILTYSGAAANHQASQWLDTVGSSPSSLTGALGTEAGVIAALIAPVIGTTSTLTTNPDTVTGGSNVVVNGTDAPAGTTTWTALDTITLIGTNNVFNLATTVAIVNPAGATVSGVQTMNVTEAGAASAIALNTTAFTGLTQLTATTAQATNVITTLTAAATTNVTLTGTTADTTAGALTVLGGNNVTVTGTGSAIVVGGSTATDPTGTVAVTDTTQAGNNVAIDGGNGVTVRTTGQTTGTVIVGHTATPAAGAVSVTVGGLHTAATTGAVTVVGGSTITISDVDVNSGALGAAAVITGTVTATGGATTTAISVTEAATVAANAGTAASANVNNLVAAVSGVTAGVVTIADNSAGSQTVANTLAAVTLNNYGNSTITSTALNTVTLSGTGGTLGITLGGTAAQVLANTTLTANLGGGSLGVISDLTAAKQIATVNAVLSANTTLAGITDTALRTLAVSGTGVLTLSATNAALTSVTLAGAAGFNGTLVGTGVTALTAANTTGAVTATLTSTTQTFTGGTGRDIITIAADATKVITGGSGTNDELILGGTTYTLANTGTEVTGFEIVGVNAGATGGAFNLANIAAGATGIDVAGAGSFTFTNVARTAGLSIDLATTAITYGTSSTTGVSDSLTVTLNGLQASPGVVNATGTIGYITTALTLADANNNAIGTVAVVTDATVAGGFDTITTLTDGGGVANLSSFSVSGTGGLDITNSIATTATSLTISDTTTSTHNDVWFGFTDASLANLTYTGTEALTLTAITNDVTPIVSIANTGTGVLTISGMIDSSNTSLTLTDKVALTFVNANTVAASVVGGSDNSAVSVTMAGATGIKTVTLGNGANTVSISNIVTGNTVTLGTGQDSVTFAGGATSTAVDNVTVGTHTLADSFTFGLTGVNFATVAGGTITGAIAVDQLHFSADNANALVIAHGTDSAVAATAIANAITAAAATIHDVGWTYDSANNTTYIADASATAGAAVGNTTVIAVVGVHTVTANGTAGLLIG